MNTSGKVAHKGKVIAVSDEKIVVNIISESACAACHAKGMCTMADTKEKNISVPAAGRHFEIGEEVLVALTSSLGLRAVWWAYLFPLILFLAVLLTLGGMKLSELYSGMAALGIVGVYYVLLWLSRNKLKRKFVFTVEKL